MLSMIFPLHDRQYARTVFFVFHTCTLLLMNDIHAQRTIHNTQRNEILFPKFFRIKSIIIHTNGLPASLLIYLHMSSRCPAPNLPPWFQSLSLVIVPLSYYCPSPSKFHSSLSSTTSHVSVMSEPRQTSADEARKNELRRATSSPHVLQLFLWRMLNFLIGYSSPTYHQSASSPNKYLTGLHVLEPVQSALWHQIPKKNCVMWGQSQLDRKKTTPFTTVPLWRPTFSIPNPNALFQLYYFRPPSNLFPSAPRINSNNNAHTQPQIAPCQSTNTCIVDGRLL